MARIFRDRLIAAIDVGTTKICVLIAHQLAEGHIEIIGIGKAPSEGLSKGVVVNVAKTVQSIKSALQEAELMAGIEIESACVGISGAHIQSVNSHGVVPIKKGLVRPSDTEAALAAAQAVPIAEGYQILHVLPQYFTIDGQERLVDPLDMAGVRLEVQAHIVCGAIASVQNLVNCCEMAGIKVNDIILEQLASADAVLSDDEKELGVAILDIGGGTSDLAIYRYGSIRHTMVLPVAGNHFTQDIAVGLRTTYKEAERIKKEHGLALSTLLSEEDEWLQLKDAHGTQYIKVSQKMLAHIIEARAKELLFLIYQEIKEQQLESFVQAGFVITGGGSLLSGIGQLAQTIMKKPVRIGIPEVQYALADSVAHPMYATGYGLLVHVMKKKKQGALLTSTGPLYKKIFMCMKSWVADFF